MSTKNYSLLKFSVFHKILSMSVNCIKEAFTGFGERVSRSSSVRAVVRFIKKNWKQIIGYLLAWSFIIISTGALYGFQAVARPLTIGFSIGIGVGCCGAVLATQVFCHDDPQKSLKYTPWNILNNGIKRLDENATRQVLLTVAVTVFLVACVTFPYVLGGLIGVFIGNQVLTKIICKQNLGPDPKERIDSRKNIQHLLKIGNEQIRKFDKQREKLENCLVQLEAADYELTTQPQ
ncbi:MAG: hypothetical protein R3E91_05505 [Chlamydiales bacterium]